jgi:hypothetical protein
MLIGLIDIGSYAFTETIAVGVINRNNISTILHKTIIIDLVCYCYRAY